MLTNEQLCAFGRTVIDIEARTIGSLISRIDDQFAQACLTLLSCGGRIIVTGMGKSGHIGRKIAATFASTGSPAFFIHSAEANHGDLGMITHQDVLLAISNSGETSEVIGMLPLVKRLNIPLICLSGKKNSTLAKAATIFIDTSIQEEACPLGLAPTSSTTATLVLGDALAIALLQAKGFTAQDFALYHPGGQLGRRLTLRVHDIMRQGDLIPSVSAQAGLNEALIEMTKKSLGMTTVLDAEGKLQGIFTDGDLRRTLNRGLNVHTTQIQEVMTRHCRSIDPQKLAAEALHLMETYKITAMTVLDLDQKLLGVVHMHDILSMRLA